MNLNLKMTVERSKCRSQFLSLVFITKCFNKNLLLRTFLILQKSEGVKPPPPPARPSARSLFSEICPEMQAVVKMAILVQFRQGC